jgi:hypothetical protein
MHKHFSLLTGLGLFATATAAFGLPPADAAESPVVGHT